MPFLQIANELDNSLTKTFYENIIPKKNENLNLEMPLLKIVTSKGREIAINRLAEVIDYYFENMKDKNERENQDQICKDILENYCRMKEFVKNQKDLILQSLESDQSKTHAMLILNYIDHVFLKNLDS